MQDETSLSLNALQKVGKSPPTRFCRHVLHTNGPYSEFIVNLLFLSRQRADNFERLSSQLPYVIFP